MKKRNVKFLSSFLLLFIVVSITIGYSAYVSELYIAGVSAEYRKVVDIRVTGVSQNTAYGDASNENLNYNVHSISGEVTLPNSDSYMVYNVVVTNYGNTEMGILNITGLDEKLGYELVNYNLKDKICNTNNVCKLGINKTFQLKVFYKEGMYDANNVIYPIKLDFEFRGYHSINYHDLTGEYPTTVIDGDTLDINFESDLPDLLVIKDNGRELLSGVDYTYLDNRLLLENVSSDLDIYKKDNTNKLLDHMLMNETSGYTVEGAKSFINSKSVPNFANQATTDEGLNLTQDEDGDVYYYRGAVNDNHVIFAGFCWRIVRSTGTGGVKLLYDGSPSNGKCNNTGSDSYIGQSPFNDSSNSPAYVGYMYGNVYEVSSMEMNTLSGNIVYGNDVTYNGETKEYTLVDTMSSDVANWSSEYTTVQRKYHYTCFTDRDTCTSVHYMNHNSETTSYYITLTQGKKHTDALKEMLTEASNEHSSKAKETVDSWYQSNLLDYTEKLEDTVFCNDRSIYSYGGWDKDTSGDKELYFGAQERVSSKKQPSLVCPNINDKFTTTSEVGNGKLLYPVGLITADEIAYAGGVLAQVNINYYLYTGDYFLWSGTPSRFSDLNYSNMNAHEFAINSSGYFGIINVRESISFRPSVSLKSGTSVVKGNGSSDNPYLVE